MTEVQNSRTIRIVEECIDSILNNSEEKESSFVHDAVSIHFSLM